MISLQPYFLRFTSISISSCSCLWCSSWLVILFGQNIFRILLKDLFTKTWSLCVTSLTTNHDSQPYRRTDLIFELKIRSLGFRLSWFRPRLGKCSLRLYDAMLNVVPPSVVICLPRYVHISINVFYQTPVQSVVRWLCFYDNTLSVAVGKDALLDQALK